MKKTLSLILAAALLLCVAPICFAATADISATKKVIKKGETVDLTVSLSDKIENCLNFEYSVYFDSEIFELQSSYKGEASSITALSAQKSDEKGSYYSVSFVDASSEGVEIKSGTVYTLTFKAIKNVEADKVSSFEIVRKSVAVLSGGEIVTNKDGDIGTSKADITVKCGGIRIPGDINGDGAVNNKDVIALFRYVSEDAENEALDMDGDGKIGNKDVLKLFKYVSKMPGIVLNKNDVK